MRVDEEEIKDGKYCPAKYVLTHVNVSLWADCRVRHDCSIFFTQLLLLSVKKKAQEKLSVVVKAKKGLKEETLTQY